MAQGGLRLKEKSGEKRLYFAYRNHIPSLYVKMFFRRMGYRLDNLTE